MQWDVFVLHTVNKNHTHSTFHQLTNNFHCIPLYLGHTISKFFINKFKPIFRHVHEVTEEYHRPLPGKAFSSITIYISLFVIVTCHMCGHIRTNGVGTPLFNQITIIINQSISHHAGRHQVIIMYNTCQTKRRIYFAWICTIRSTWMERPGHGVGWTIAQSE